MEIRCELKRKKKKYRKKSDFFLCFSKFLLNLWTEALHKDKSLKHHQSKFVGIELMGLTINLSLNSVACEKMAKYLHYLIKRVHHTMDPLLMKLIRNISASQELSIKQMFQVNKKKNQKQKTFFV